MVIAESTICSVRFLGLLRLYSAYTLVLKRPVIAYSTNAKLLTYAPRNMFMLEVRPSYDGPLGLVFRIISNRKIIRVALLSPSFWASLPGYVSGDSRASGSI